MTVNAQDVVIKSEPDYVNVTWRNNLVRCSYGAATSTPDALDGIYEAA